MKYCRMGAAIKVVECSLKTIESITVCQKEGALQEKLISQLQ